MAWYCGTYTCGHEGRTNVIGPTKNRQWKIDRHFDDICPDCKEVKRMEENEKSAKLAIEMELPELTGTEKQVAWANTIRVKATGKFDFEVEDEKNEDKKRLLGEAFQFILQNRTKASWWIDTRSDGARSMGEEALVEMKAMEESVLPESVVSETVLIPEDLTKDGIVVITVTEKVIKAEYAKDEDFIEVVKLLGFKWERPWSKHISITSGTATDRAAELGNHLLNAGFSVQIQDPDIRDKAISADYVPECKRWVMYDCKNKKLTIRWFDGRNSRLYETARKIKSAKWDGESSSVLVNIEHFPEVEDFADSFGFKLSPRAISEIDSYKESIAKILPVHASVPNERGGVDKLSEILGSGFDVISDLIDDESHN